MPVPANIFVRAANEERELKDSIRGLCVVRVPDAVAVRSVLCAEKLVNKLMPS